MLVVLGLGIVEFAFGAYVNIRKHSWGAYIFAGLACATLAAFVALAIYLAREWKKIEVTDARSV